MNGFLIGYAAGSGKSTGIGGGLLLVGVALMFLHPGLFLLLVLPFLFKSKKRRKR